MLSAQVNGNQVNGNRVNGNRVNGNRVNGNTVLEISQPYRFCPDDQEIVHDKSEVSAWIWTNLTPKI